VGTLRLNPLTNAWLAYALVVIIGQVIWALLAIYVIWP
jgi:hypothetical protein